MIAPTIDGETVPVTIAREDLDRYTGDLPASVEVDRIFRDDDRLLGWSFLEDGSLVEVEYETMQATQFEDPDRIQPVGRAIWTRPDQTEDELTWLLGQDITPAKAVDYWGVKMRGFTRTDWADKRNVSHQAVAENVSVAEDVLESGTASDESED